MYNLFQSLPYLYNSSLMEVNSDRDKSEISSLDTQTHTIRSIKLGRGKRSSAKALTSSCDRMRTSCNLQLLSSISRKLKPQNIEVLSKPSESRMSDPFHRRSPLLISCFPQTMNSQCSYNNNYASYWLLKTTPSPVQSVIQHVHANIGEKKGCIQQNCPIKRKWMRKIAFYERQIKNALLLREKINYCPNDIAQQIDKDVTRTYHSHVLTKTKIVVSQLGADKFNLIDNLRIVLRLYAIFDNEVEYVQGLNLVCGAVALHMKEINGCFVFFKEIMVYGKLRSFYINDFSLVKQQLKSMFHKQLKFLNLQLYMYLVESGVDYLLFLPYYITLFGAFIEIHYMHIIIDLFMRDGVSFLHKLCLTLLLYLKQTLMTYGQEDYVITKLGSSYIKDMAINWQDVIVNSLKLDLI